MVLSSLAGGYFGPGGRSNRPGLAAWNPGVADADGDISPDLVDLRGFSRDLARKNPLAGGAINTTVTYTVGTGLSLQPTPDAEFLRLSPGKALAWATNTARRWSMWAETTDCDITRSQNFYGLQPLALRSALESGDVFALFPTTVRGFAVQLIEADRVSNPGRRADRANLTQGIEFDEYGAPQKYHISTRHPGSLRSGALEWVEVSAFGAETGRRNVLHLFDRRRPGQTRGVPYLAPVIEPLKQLGRYTDAELSAAVNSAAFAFFIRMDPDAFADLFTSSEDQQGYLDAAKRWDGGLDNPGKAINLLPGEEPVSPKLDRPNTAFDPFVMSIYRHIGVGLDLPVEVLIKHFQASYSAARAAMLDAARFFRGRRDWLAGSFCQPIYELWLEWEIANGHIPAPGFFADPNYRNAWTQALWTGDGPGSLDPLKEVNASILRIGQGISTIAAESMLHDGVTWEVKHRQRGVEMAARRAAGLEDPAPLPEQIVLPEV